MGMDMDIDIEFGESMFQCPSHPSEEVVGICASCLRERLHCLKGKNKLRRPSLQNIVYSSDSDSCSGFDVPQKSSVEKRDIVARKKFLWLTKTKNPRSSSQKKEKRTFFSLPSIFHRLRRNKEDSKEDTCISHDDSFVSIKLDGNGKSDQDAIFSDSSGRRMNTLSHYKDYYGNHYHYHNRNQYQYQYPTSKIWSLSSLYNNDNDNDRHCITSKKSWIRSLTSPKWSLRSLKVK